MLLTQWSPEPIAAASFALAVLGGLAHVVWTMSRAIAKLDHLEHAVTDERLTRQARDGRVFDRLDNHEVRIVRLEESGGP